MKYRIAAFLAFAAAALGLLLADHVPGATDKDGQFTTEFWLNSYFVVMGFVVTTAAVSPLIALFIDWRSDLAWRPARLNVRRDLAKALNDAMTGYSSFLETVSAGDPHRLTAVTLDQIQRGLTDFFDTYESEQAAFSAEMHSAASRLRLRLRPFRRALQSTLLMVNGQRSYRFYVKQNTIDDLRAAFDKSPLSSASALAGNRYFAENGELFCDVRLDAQLGSGVIPIQRFVALEFADLHREWKEFVSTCPGEPSDEEARIRVDLTCDPATQARLHAEYARNHIREPWMAELVVAPDAALPPEPVALPTLVVPPASAPG